MTSNQEEKSKAKIVQSIELRKAFETRWIALFERQQRERDLIYKEGGLSAIWRAALIYRIAKVHSPAAGMKSIFNTVTTPSEREALLGKHQLAERKAMAKSFVHEIMAAHRKIDELSHR